MAQLVEVKVPDIGDFKDVAVIEVMVSRASDRRRHRPDHGRVRQGLDGDPVVAGGRGEGAQVKLGDKVSEGSVILA